MKLVLLTMTLFCAILTRSTVDPETKLMIPTSWDDYYGELYNHPIILVTFYESKESSEMTEKILTTSSYLRNTEFMDSREIPVMVVDMSLVPKVKSFYDFETSNHMWLFVKNRAYKFEEFENMVKLHDSDISITNTYDWVERTVNGLIVEVDSFSRFRAELAQNRIVTVYFGDKNENYDKFVNWVLQYSKEPLYCVFDETAREQIIKHYDVNHIYSMVNKKDVISIIWHPEELTEMDSARFLYADDFDDTKNLDLFYLFETRPRIRKDSSTSDNVFLMYQRQLPLFLFNYKEDANSKQRLQAVNNALKILPKRFVYDVFEHESRRAIDYQHIMIQSNNYNLIEPNTLYIVWLYHGTKPQIMKFEKSFTTEEIVDWTFNFGKMFPHLFGSNNDTGKKVEDNQDDKFEAEDL